MKTTTKLVAAVACALLATSALTAQSSVSTAIGNGADVQLTAASVALATPTDASSNGEQMNSRFNFTETGTSNNDIIALRFDLTGFNLSTASNASLSLFSYRDDGSNRAIEVYGVTPFAAGKDNNGTVGGFNSTNWSETTVKFSTMPGLEWDNTVTVSDFDLDTANTTLLASATLTGAELGLGTLHTVSGAAIATFLQSHTSTNQVTLLIRAGNTSSGQARFGTKESTGLNGITGAVPAGTYAPYLTFTASAAVPEPSTFAALAGAAALVFATSRRRRS